MVGGRRQYTRRRGMTGIVPRRYVMVFSGRTGTTVTVDAINQHPLARFEGEIPATFLGARDPVAAQAEWVNSFFSADTSAEVLGFKTKFHDLADVRSFADAFVAFEPTVIVSRRRNLFKQAVSAVRIHKRAERLAAQMSEEEYKSAIAGNRAWNVVDDDYRLPPVSLDVEELLDQLKWIVDSERSIDEFIESIRPSVAGVSTWWYESLLINQDAYFAKVWKDLRLEAPEFKLRFSKHTDDDLRTAIENYDEIHAAVARSSYGEYLEL